LPEITRRYGKALITLRFDDRFAKGWSMADPLPSSLYKDDQYVGPAIENFMGREAWATKLLKKDGKKTYVLTDAIRAEWFYAVGTKVFIHRHFPTRYVYTARQFNNAMAPFSDVANLAKLFARDGRA
jgi:hypothetical protein